MSNGKLIIQCNSNNVNENGVMAFNDYTAMAIQWLLIMANMSMWQ